MRVKIEKDPSLDACNVTHESVRLERPADVAEWRAQLMAEAEAAIGDGRAYLLVDYAGFSVGPLVADAYGEVAEEFRQRFAKEVFRYNVGDQSSSSAAILQSLRRTHSGNVFASRQEAIQALQRARRTR